MQYGYYEKPQFITAAEDKPAAFVAGHIARRLLPKYLPFLAEKLHSKQANDKWEGGKAATYSAALAVVGISDAKGRAYVGPNNISIKASSPHTIELGHFDVTPEQLKKIVEAVPELFKKEV